MIDWESMKPSQFRSVREWILEEYVRLKSIPATAAHLGVAKHALKSKMRELEIPLRKRGGPNNRKAVRALALIDEKAWEDLTVEELAGLAGCSTSAVVRYRKLYRRTV